MSDVWLCPCGVVNRGQGECVHSYPKRELPEVEQAAIRVIERSPDDLVSDEELARTVVARVRPLIASKALSDAAEALDKLCGSAPLQALDGIVYACNELSKMAVLEGEQDHA